MDLILFYIVAAVAIFSGALVVKARNPVHSALSLVLTFLCLATFYVMLEAPFMAFLNLLVYAGAIMVLIIFVIMLLNLGTGVQKTYTHTVLGGLIAAVLVLFTTVSFLKQSEVGGTKGEITSDLIAQVGHSELIGQALFTDFLLPFEITSILLLVAIIGAVVIAKRNV